MKKNTKTQKPVSEVSCFPQFGNFLDVVTAAKGGPPIIILLIKTKIDF